MLSGISVVEKLILAVVVAVASWHGTRVWLVAGVSSLVVVSVSDGSEFG